MNTNLTKFVFTFICSALWALHAGAVSRVGGGKIRSNSSGFETEIPESFALIESSTDNSLRASGRPVLTRENGLTRQYVEIVEFDQEFPDAVGLSALELQSRFSKAGWTPVPANEHCALAISSSNNRVTARIVTWGSGRGFVLKGPALPDVQKVMAELISNMKLDNGACAWK